MTGGMQGVGTMRRVLVVVALALAAASCAEGDPAAAPTATVTVTVTATPKAEDVDDPYAANPPRVGYGNADELVTALADAGFTVDGLAKVPAGETYSGIDESWDVTVDGVEAGLNFFPNPNATTVWVGMSEGFGGIAVVGDQWAVSLDSEHPAKAESVKLAPRIAEAIGGVVSR